MIVSLLIFGLRSISCHISFCMPFHAMMLGVIGTIYTQLLCVVSYLVSIRRSAIKICQAHFNKKNFFADRKGNAVSGSNYIHCSATSLQNALNFVLIFSIAYTLTENEKITKYILFINFIFIFDIESNNEQKYNLICTIFSKLQVID